VLLIPFLAAGPAASANAVNGPDAASNNSLFVGGQFIDVSAGARGFTGDLDWIRSFSTGRSLNIGASSLSLAGTRWTYARLGVTAKPRSRAAFQLTTDLGRGTQGRQGFGYAAVRGAITYEAVPKRLYVEIEDQLLDVQETAGNIVKLGLVWPASASLVGRVAVHATTHGNVDTRALALRVDHARGGFSTFGGFAAGRSRPVLVGLGAGGKAQDLREVFAGAGMPLGRLRLTLALDWLTLGETRRGSVALSVKIPL